MATLNNGLNLLYGPKLTIELRNGVEWGFGWNMRNETGLSWVADVAMEIPFRLSKKEKRNNHDLYKISFCQFKDFVRNRKLFDMRPSEGHWRS